MSPHETLSELIRRGTRVGSLGPDDMRPPLVGETEELRQAMTQVFLAAKLLADVDLIMLLRSYERAEAIGCYIDPTQWQRRLGEIQSTIALLRAAMPMYREYRRLCVQNKVMSGEGRS